jgi:hypothetical protein
MERSERMLQKSNASASQWFNKVGSISLIGYHSQHYIKAEIACREEQS